MWNSPDTSLAGQLIHVGSGIWHVSHLLMAPFPGKNRRHYSLTQCFASPRQQACLLYAMSTAEITWSHKQVSVSRTSGPGSCTGKVCPEQNCSPKCLVQGQMSCFPNGNRKKHLDSYLKWRVLPGVVAHTCHPTAQAAEAEGSKHQHQPEIQEPKANETAQWVTEYHCIHSYREMGGRWRSESPRGL